MCKIYLNNMEFYGFHGCFPEEKIVGTYFNVDLIVETDTSKAQKTDLIDDTLNYLDLYQLVKKEMKIKANLLEHLAERIVNQAMNEFPTITIITITLSKMNPPLGGKLSSVSVEIQKTRN